LPPEVRRLKQVLDAEAAAREQKLREEAEALKKQLGTQQPLRDQFLQQKQASSIINF
jgi:hypothetical protein